jgi:cyanophycin synthetase
MVEQFAKGYHHRLLVVGNRMVAAAKGHSETVTGDGKQSITELVEEVNRDPRRGEAYTDPLDVLKLNAAVMIELKKQGFDADSIPADGQIVLIRRTGDLTTDCTDQVHPDLAEQAVLAARVVGLDIAGLDILATDISQPLEAQSGAVVEVNAGPSLSPHVSPLFGKPQKVGDAIVDLLFPNDSPSRIQLIGIVQSRTSDMLVEQLSAQLRLRNLDFGMVSHGQAGFNGRIVDTGCENDASRVVALLGNPILSALVIHVDLETSATLGTCAPRLDWLIIPRDVIPEHPTTEQQAGLRAIIHAVPPNGHIFCDGLPESVWHSIVDSKQSSTKAQNTLDGAFEV